MSRRALITGISGFVGGYLAEHLLAAGDLVLGCTPDGQWTDSSPDSIRNGVRLFAWDFSRTEQDWRQIQRYAAEFQPEVIYHLAAITVPRECGDERPTPLAMLVNVEGTRRVMELAASLASRPRVLFTSSSHVYPPVKPGSGPISESVRAEPVSAYGKTKLDAEIEVRRAAGRGPCQAVIARAFQHTGPRQGPQMMLPHWAKQFAQGGPGPVAVYTQNAWLDLTDVRDVVRAYRMLAELGGRGDVYNVGSGISRRSGDILVLLQQLADARRPIVELNPGFQQQPVADVTRLAQATGWRPTIPIEKTIADTFTWWKNNLQVSSPQLPSRPPSL